MKKAIVCEKCADGRRNPVSIQKRNRWKAFFISNNSSRRIKLVCLVCGNAKEFVR